MNDQQWATLVAVVKGEHVAPLPTGFIIDSPWLPNWAGHTILDYYTRDDLFLADNLKAIDTFPGTIFLPGFWSEYGMCTEPSAFGARLVWGHDDFPAPEKILRSPADVELLERPDPRKHGLLPFVVNRLRHLQPRIEEAGHRIRFAVARGPLNIASFLMGTTEFLLALKTAPGAAHRLIDVATDFLVDWIAYQRECFPSIDGLLVLDDIVGFIGPDDFREFALAPLTRVFGTDVTVKCFHNDAPCRACAPYLAQTGINLLNFGIQHTLTEMRGWTGGGIALLGNVPPRDVLAAGTPEDVTRSVTEMLAAVGDTSRVIASCGGGMPPGVSTENIAAFIAAVDAFGLRSRTS
jgi:uroporphyrinogen-III decarboxylase